VQFYTKYAFIILFCAVLTAHLSGELTALPQASWLDSVEERRRGKGRGKKVAGEKEDKGRKEMGRGQRGKKGKERDEGSKREEFCSVAIFP